MADSTTKSTWTGATTAAYLDKLISNSQQQSQSQSSVSSALASAEAKANQAASRPPSGSSGGYVPTSRKSSLGARLNTSKGPPPASQSKYSGPAFTNALGDIGAQIAKAPNNINVSNVSKPTQDARASGFNQRIDDFQRRMGTGDYRKGASKDVAAEAIRRQEEYNKTKDYYNMLSSTKPQSKSETTIFKTEIVGDVKSSGMNLNEAWTQSFGSQAHRAAPQDSMQKLQFILDDLNAGIKPQYALTDAEITELEALGPLKYDDGRSVSIREFNTEVKNYYAQVDKVNRKNEAMTEGYNKALVAYEKLERINNDLNAGKPTTERLSTYELALLRNYGVLDKAQGNINKQFDSRVENINELSKQGMFVRPDASKEEIIKDAKDRGFDFVEIGSTDPTVVKGLQDKGQIPTDAKPGDQFFVAPIRSQAYYKLSFKAGEDPKVIDTKLAEMREAGYGAYTISIDKDGNRNYVYQPLRDPKPISGVEKKPFFKEIPQGDALQQAGTALYGVGTDIAFGTAELANEASRYMFRPFIGTPLSEGGYEIRKGMVAGWQEKYGQPTMVSDLIKGGIGIAQGEITEADLAKRVEEYTKNPVYMTASLGGEAVSFLTPGAYAKIGKAAPLLRNLGKFSDAEKLALLAQRAGVSQDVVQQVGKATPAIITKSTTVKNLVGDFKAIEAAIAKKTQRIDELEKIGKNQVLSTKEGLELTAAQAEKGFLENLKAAHKVIDDKIDTVNDVINIVRREGGSKTIRVSEDPDFIKKLEDIGVVLGKNESDIVTVTSEGMAKVKTQFVNDIKRIYGEAAELGAKSKMSGIEMVLGRDAAVRTKEAGLKELETAFRIPASPKSRDLGNLVTKLEGEQDVLLQAGKTADADKTAKLLDSARAGQARMQKLESEYSEAVKLEKEFQRAARDATRAGDAKEAERLQSLLSGQKQTVKMLKDEMERTSQGLGQSLGLERRIPVPRPFGVDTVSFLGQTLQVPKWAGQTVLKTKDGQVIGYFTGDKFVRGYVAEGDTAQQLGGRLLDAMNWTKDALKKTRDKIEDAKKAFAKEPTRENEEYLQSLRNSEGELIERLRSLDPTVRLKQRLQFDTKKLEGLTQQVRSKERDIEIKILQDDIAKQTKQLELLEAVQPVPLEYVSIAAEDVTRLTPYIGEPLRTTGNLATEGVARLRGGIEIGADLPRSLASRFGIFTREGGLEKLSEGLGISAKGAYSGIDKGQPLIGRVVVETTRPTKGGSSFLDDIGSLFGRGGGGGGRGGGGGGFDITGGKGMSFDKAYKTIKAAEKEAKSALKAAESDATKAVKKLDDNTEKLNQAKSAGESPKIVQQLESKVDEAANSLREANSKIQSAAQKMAEAQVAEEALKRTGSTGAMLGGALSGLASFGRIQEAYGEEGGVASIATEQPQESEFSTVPDDGSTSISIPSFKLDRSPAPRSASGFGGTSLGSITNQLERSPLLNDTKTPTSTSLGSEALLLEDPIQEPTNSPSEEELLIERLRKEVAKDRAKFNELKARFAKAKTPAEMQILIDQMNTLSGKILENERRIESIPVPPTFGIMSLQSFEPIEASSSVRADAPFGVVMRSNFSGPPELQRELENMRQVRQAEINERRQEDFAHRQRDSGYRQKVQEEYEIIRNRVDPEGIPGNPGFPMLAFGARPRTKGGKQQIVPIDVESKKPILPWYFGTSPTRQIDQVRILPPGAPGVGGLLDKLIVETLGDPTQRDGERPGIMVAPTLFPPSYAWVQEPAVDTVTVRTPMLGTLNIPDMVVPTRTPPPPPPEVPAPRWPGLPFTLPDGGGGGGDVPRRGRWIRRGERRYKQADILGLIFGDNISKQRRAELEDEGV